MSSWQHDPRPARPYSHTSRHQAPHQSSHQASHQSPQQSPHRATAAYVTLAGADWLASASPFPQSVHALWCDQPSAPVVLPCGTAFDVISAPALFGRRLLDRLWSAGPGSGPVAAQRGRLLLFAAPGTAQRLPALLAWEEWSRAVPPLLCHGKGDAVTAPALYPPGEEEPTAPVSRWLVAPEVRHPWLPGPEVLLWACVRAAREGAATESAGGGGAEAAPFATPTPAPR